MIQEFKFDTDKDMFVVVHMQKGNSIENTIGINGDLNGLISMMSSSMMADKDMRKIILEAIKVTMEVYAQKVEEAEKDGE